MQKIVFILMVLFFYSVNCFAQLQDSAVINPSVPENTAVKKQFDPRKATIRSAIIPGWGQIYNKKYWKLPLVYGALGTTAGIFFYNTKTYKELKQAYIYRSDDDPSNDSLIPLEYSSLSKESLRSYRNSFRQNIDYSVLFFILFWGLNVVDATVDAHLKAFEVNDDLSFYLHPGYSEMANTSGISIVMKIGK